MATLKSIMEEVEKLTNEPAPAISEETLLRWLDRYFYPQEAKINLNEAQARKLAQYAADMYKRQQSARTE